MSELDETRLSDELTKFGVLVIVMIVVVLVVALSRPLIFEVIVPVVLGDGLVTPAQPLEPISPAVEAPPVEEPAVEAPVDDIPAAQESETDTAASPAEEVPVEAESEPMEALPTLVTATTHVVKTGETLTVISDQYNISVQAIVNANNLPSADRIQVGDLLTIPQE